MRCNQPLGFSMALMAAIVLGGATDLAADSPQPPDPSQYAPIRDLQAQVEMFVEQIEKDLAEEAEYGDDQKYRLLLNASTLIVLGQTLGVHDQEHDLRLAAPALIDAATSLADNSEDYAAAKDALSEVKKSLGSRAARDVDWEPIAELQYLMMQVPIVNNSLRRGVTGRRFDRMIDKSAGSAATLAAIAQASVAYTDYCVDEEDEQKWAKICEEMRDAAAQVNTAVRNKDKAAANAGLAALVKTCDACHESFRD